MSSLAPEISPEVGITAWDAAASSRVLFFPFDSSSAQTLAEAEKTLSASADVARLPFDLTIIIPIFNVQHYALDTLRSVLVAASQLRVQIICVNDGSTDNSLQLVTNFLRERNCRAALVVDQPNRGLGAARNAALPFVCGEYLASLDSDDIVDASGYADLLAFAREYDCDLVWGRSTCFSNDLQERGDFVDKWIWDGIVGGRQAVALCPEFDHRIFMVEANSSPRIARTVFFKQHQFLYPNGIFEDLPVQPALLTRARRVGFVDTPVYYWRIERPGQLTQERSQRCFDVITMFRASLDEILKSHYSPQHGASFLYWISRLLIWGAKGLPLDLRKAYFERACQEFKRVPEQWVTAFLERFSDLNVVILPRVRRFNLAFMVWCFAHGEAEALWWRSTNARSIWLSARFLWQVHGVRSLVSHARAACGRLAARYGSGS